MQEVDIPMLEKYLLEEVEVDNTNEVKELDANGEYNKAEKLMARTERINFARAILRTMGQEQKLTYRSLMNGTVGKNVGVIDREVAASLIKFMKHGIACSIFDTINSVDKKPIKKMGIPYKFVLSLLRQEMSEERIIETFQCIDEFTPPLLLELD